MFVGYVLGGAGAGGWTFKKFLDVKEEQGLSAAVIACDERGSDRHGFHKYIS